MCACALAEPCLTLCDPVDRTPPGSSVHGIPRDGDGSELLFPSPGVLPNPGIEPASPALAGEFCTTALPGKPTPPSGLFPNTVDFNNIGLNCEGSLTCGNFSVVNSTLLYGMWFVESANGWELRIQGTDHIL